VKIGIPVFALCDRSGYNISILKNKNSIMWQVSTIMSESIRAVERALDVLACFSHQTPELTMTQIADQIGINKSTVHRLLATLEGKRFVERDPATGIYKLGIRALQMAYLALEHNDLRRLAAPYLQNLCNQYRENVNLAVLEGADVVYLDVIEGTQRVKLAAAIGQRLPAFCTASGKAILACMPQEKVQRILEPGLPRHTQYTITSPEAYFENMLFTRTRGFATSEQEYEDGINAVAASILPLGSYGNSQPVGSISVAGPSYRLTHERMIEIGATVLATAQEIAQEMQKMVHPLHRSGKATPSDTK
jgi:DNA-binding IclR family transcriptional regulator